MKNSFSFIVAFLLTLILSFNVFAASGYLFTGPSTFWIAPKVYNKTLYGAYNASSTWHITQWGSPGANMPAFSSNMTAGCCEGIVLGAGNSYTINQVTYANPALACGAEFDSFAEVNDPGTYPGYPSGHVTVSPTLQNMNSLGLNISLIIQHMDVVDNKCQINQNSQMIAIVLQNKVKGQVLFYQIELGGYYNRSGLPKQFWWSTTSPFGYTETAAIGYNTPQAVPGIKRIFNLNILPNLKRIIASSPASMDKNLNDWIVSSTYHGSAVWGHMSVSANWSNFSLIWNN